MHNAELLTFVTHETNLGAGDLAINALFLFLSYGSVSKKQKITQRCVIQSHASSAVSVLPVSYDPNPDRHGRVLQLVRHFSLLHRPRSGTAAYADYVPGFYSQSFRSANRLQQD